MKIMQSKRAVISLLVLVALFSFFIGTVFLRKEKFKRSLEWGVVTSKPDDSAFRSAMYDASRVGSKAEKAQIYLRATEHFNPLNAHDGEEIAEEVALSGCKLEYSKALEHYLHNEGASLPLGRKDFLLRFASAIPDHITK